MRSFSTTELARMQATQNAAMQDTCQIGAYTAGSAGTYGMVAVTYTYGDALSCGLEHLSPREMLPSTDAPTIDARIRLPVGTTITSRDLVKITYRYGVELGTAQVYQVVGPPRRGPSGLVCDLRLSTDG